MKMERTSTAGSALANRRTLIETPTPILGSLRWPSRPDLPDGNPCWTYMVHGSHGHYAVAVGHVENGASHPFEVWILATEQPRCLGAVAKTLSADLRSQDRAWLALKLGALGALSGNLIINQQLGRERLAASSNSAALARIVRYRLRQLNDEVAEGKGTSLVDALLPMLEAGHEGTLSWTANIRNPMVGDEFTVFLPEVETTDGVQRPIGVRLSGRYPGDLDGLAALLTLDMAVVDVAWIGMKLRKLVNYDEPMGAFFAKSPGSGVSERFPSTVAYLARLIICRYAMLGLLTEAGYPVAEMGIMVSVPGDASNVLPHAA